MQKEKSFGVIPVQRKEGRWRVFLVHHQKGHWAFPKGHAEEGEDEKTAAERECKEETGLDIVRYLRESPFSERYFYAWEGEKREKRVLYFLAEVEGEIAIQKEELIEGEWFPLEDAEGQMTFLEGKKVCQEVLSFLLGYPKLL